ncbi:hypothetical protein E2C01_011663 [Portunus trituberculatus]|uniref:Uncharacterized protein n=1 Tax=Portunus trituberculatus TaxID=210409 RepID=A0A5B7DBQ0_PORTR|nr:hypothetical protein [Portunus trituberculatus]
MSERRPTATPTRNSPPRPPPTPPVRDGRAESLLVVVVVARRGRQRQVLSGRICAMRSRISRWTTAVVVVGVCWAAGVRCEAVSAATMVALGQVKAMRSRSPSLMVQESRDRCTQALDRQCL